MNFQAQKNLLVDFKSEKNNNAGITEAEENIIEQPYYTQAVKHIHLVTIKELL